MKRRLHPHRTRLESALTTRERQKRAREKKKLLRQFPGTVILGRYGRVQMPFRYGLQEDEFHNVSWNRIESLYG